MSRICPRQGVDVRKKPTTKTLKRKLTKVFNAMVRARDAEFPCISCGEYRELQAGHFVPCGKSLATRWHPWNVNGECAGCNGFDQMHLVGYTRGLERRYCGGTIEKIMQLAKVRWKPLPDQLERLILACDSPEDYESEWFAVQREFAPEVNQ